MELIQRKPNRSKNFDYGRPGAYFVTVCTDKRKQILWEHRNTPANQNTTVGERIALPSNVRLSPYGKIIDEAINHIPRVYPRISVDCYVIMPNHIHLLLQIHTDANGSAMRSPTGKIDTDVEMNGMKDVAPNQTIDTVICQMKGYVTKRIGRSIWQRSYHDHVIRNRQDYEDTVRYIHENPVRWYYDELYSDES